MSTHVLAAEDLSGFGTDPWWLIVIKVLFIFVFLVLSVLLTMWAERRILGRMQLRLGPNRHGPFGLLQGLADGLKLGVKEDLVPKDVDKWVYILAPAAASAPAFISFAIIPFGPQVSIFGHTTHLQLTDLPVAVLLVLAMASMGVYGFVLAGWASGSPFALLGGLRSSAQVISYEIAMALTFVAVFLYAGTLSTSGIVDAQERLWFAVVLIPSFLIYLVTMVGETNRIPFDLPEGEGELVGGYHTEYSSMKFAMFFLAEYVNMSTVCGLSVTLFLGGWRAPAPISTIWADANAGWWPMLWFVIKFALVMFIFIWLRAAMPRVRYDQLMKLGWKVLIPVSIVWIIVVATMRGLRNDNASTATWLTVLGAGLVIALVAIYLWDRAAEKRRELREQTKEQEFATLKAKPMAGGFPVPPLRAAHYGADVRDALEAPRSDDRPDGSRSAKEVTGA